MQKELKKITYEQQVKLIQLLVDEIIITGKHIKIIFIIPLDNGDNKQGNTPKKPSQGGGSQPDQKCPGFPNLVERIRNNWKQIVKELKRWEVAIKSLSLAVRLVKSRPP